MHYTGTIVFEVKGDFGTISYNCYSGSYSSSFYVSIALHQAIKASLKT